MNKLMLRINQWFNRPLGDTGAVPDSPETGLKKPLEVFETPSYQPILMKGRGDKREMVRRKDEFFPRGAAGRREVHGSEGPHKAQMPHHGSRSKNPK